MLEKLQALKNRILVDSEIDDLTPEENDYLEQVTGLNETLRNTNTRNDQLVAIAWDAAIALGATDEIRWDSCIMADSLFPVGRSLLPPGEKSTRRRKGGRGPALCGRRALRRAGEVVCRERSRPPSGGARERALRRWRSARGSACKGDYFSVRSGL